MGGLSEHLSVIPDPQRVNKEWARAVTPPRRRADLDSVSRALSWQRIVLCAAGFFLGRAVLMGELSPFAPAFAGAALYSFGPAAWPAVAAMLLGQATVLQGVAMAQSLLITAGVGLALRAMPGDFRRPSLVVAALIPAVTVVVKASFLAFASAALYDYVALMVEAALAGVFTYVMISAFAPRTRPLSGEEFFCYIVMLAGIIAGMGRLSIASVTLAGVSSKFAVLLAAILGGGGVGAAGGAVVGVVPGVAFVAAPAAIGVYAFAGFLAGVCRRFGKLGVAIGFLLGNIILAVYINDYSDLESVLVEAAIAVAFFVLVPVRWMEKLRYVLPEGALGAAASDDKVKEIIKARVGGWARMFDELSRTFAQVSSTGPDVKGDTTLEELLDEVRNRICRECPLHKSCWERDSYRTHQEFFDVLRAVEATGKVTADDFPEHVRRRCLRVNELALTLTCLYETYRVNRYWYRRLVESREVVSEHLRGLANIMQNMSAELCSTVENAGRVEVALRRKFNQLDIPVTYIASSPRDDGRLEIRISRPPCHGELACRYMMAPVVSKVIGQPFTVGAMKCSTGGEFADCTFNLYPALRYRVDVGVAKAGKDGSPVSGDTYSFLNLREGKFCMLLSDGMGVGPQAAMESSTTVSLLENLFESGFGQDMAVKTVNSILLLRAPDESFATVDITVIDLYSGKAECVKIGAAPSFILSGTNVRVIRSASLPVGILKDIEVNSVVKNVGVGDVVVMVTDGVLDAYGGSQEKESWLADVISEIGAVEPQQMADLILERARQAAGGLIPDDMTVLVGRIGKTMS